MRGCTRKAPRQNEYHAPGRFFDTTGLERRAAGQQAVKDGTERINVAVYPNPVRLARCLFGRHIAWRAQDLAGCRVLRGRVTGLYSFGEAKFGNARLSVFVN